MPEWLRGTTRVQTISQRQFRQEGFRPVLELGENTLRSLKCQDITGRLCSPRWTPGWGSELSINGSMAVITKPKMTCRWSLWRCRSFQMIFKQKTKSSLSKWREMLTSIDRPTNAWRSRSTQASPTTSRGCSMPICKMASQDGRMPFSSTDTETR